MKKRLLVLIPALILSFASCSPSNDKENNKQSEITEGESTSEIQHEEENLVDTTTVRIHYHRDDKDYTTWGLWLWMNLPSSGSGKNVTFTNSDDIYGYYVDIDVTKGAYSGAKQLGFIVKTDLDEPFEFGTPLKDVASDRFINVSEQSNNGIQDIFVYQGDSNVYYSIDDAISNKILSAKFTTTTKIVCELAYSTTTKEVTASMFHLYSGDEETRNYTFNCKGTTLTIDVKDKIDISKQYRISIDFNNGVKSSIVGIGVFYDTADFINNYTYYGNDLGVTFNSNKSATTFKLWAPVSENVILNLYDNGTPDSIDGNANSKFPYKRLNMHLEQKGVWAITVPEYLNNKYYTYTVINGTGSEEVVDPYAKACGINGLRGMIIDFDTIDEEIEGWDQVTYSDENHSGVNSIVYESHIRDLTVDETSGVKDEYRGKYLGLTQEGTKYTKNGVSVSTGLDHLKELGITHVQLLPFYDYNSVDETTCKEYNWGYDPLNYNCLEGSYSTNPYDGRTRIVEFKKMVKSLYDSGVSVIMDVVYNHTAGSANTNFEKIIPGYYHRMNEDGTFSDGSGCGNEMASQRPMMRKFIVDSTNFWCKEYKISGFRFDLMKLLDTTTMNEVYTTLKEINPNVVVYGEPWAGGSTPGTYVGTVQSNLSTISGVGAFNDHIRDAIRGSNNPSSGWVNGGASTENSGKIVNGIKGTFYGANIDPTRVVNYVSCHDNYTLNDQISKTMPSISSSSLKMRNTQADSIILFSEGIPFMQEGEDFLRTKGGEHNSYNKGDKVNKMDYSLKLANIDEFNTIKAAIALRKSFAGFRLKTNNEVNSSLSEVVGSSSKISYIINYDGETYYVVHASTSGNIDVSNYSKLVYSNKKNSSYSANYSLSANETAVFKK